MKKTFILISFLSLFSCVRAEKEQVTSVTLNFPETWGSSQSVSPMSLNSDIVPANLAELNCFAVLVSGPEDGMRRNTCYYKNTATAFPVGKFFGGFFRATGATGSSFSFEVPNGKDRKMHLIGFKAVAPSAAISVGTTNEKVCTQFFNDESLESYLSEPYIISEKDGIVMNGDPLTVNLTATLNTSYKVGDCKGPDFPDLGNGNTSGGPPYQFGISFQDGIGTSLKKLSAGKCFAVRVQVQDSSGSRANMSGTNITGKINTLSGGTSIGTFYHASDSSYACAPGTEITTVSDYAPIEFFNSATSVSFPDRVIYFKPSGSQGTTGNFSVVELASSPTLIAGSISFQYDSVNTYPATNYAVYDLYNNRSSASSSSVNRNVVKLNECRVGQVQFLDALGIPSILNLSGTLQSIIVTSVDTSAISFYSNSSDCSLGLNSSSQRVINPPTYTNFAGVPFYYKVISNSAISSFSFTVTNGVGSGTPAVISGELTSGSNYWGAQ